MKYIKRDGRVDRWINKVLIFIFDGAIIYSYGKLGDQSFFIPPAEYASAFGSSHGSPGPLCSLTPIINCFPFVSKSNPNDK
jgi:hypothetical protein